MAEHHGRDGANEGVKSFLASFHCFVHGGTSSLLSTLIVFPVYKTVFRQQIHNTPIRHAVRQLYKEGPVKLFRGVTPPLVKQTLNGTLLFGLQDRLRRHLSLPSALAGLGAGVVEGLVFTPFERVQNVRQNGKNDISFPSLKSVLVRLRSENLASGYYRAFLPITVRNALGSCLYFGLKEPMPAFGDRQGLPQWISSFISGTLISIPISLSLYPLSVLASNMQAEVNQEVKGVMVCWKMLWESRQRSIALLYRGGSLVILRSCLTWGITTAFFDKQEIWLQSRH
ncbi:unnamed protein product [Lampetra planeri]